LLNLIEFLGRVKPPLFWRLRMFKAKENFKCNSLKKNKGELISADEVKVIGDLLEDLLKDGLIENAEEKKPVRKKRVTKKKVN
jgi:hypothetical protein